MITLPKNLPLCLPAPAPTPRRQPPIEPFIYHHPQHSRFIVNRTVLHYKIQKTFCYSSDPSCRQQHDALHAARLYKAAMLTGISVLKLDRKLWTKDNIIALHHLLALRFAYYSVHSPHVPHASPNNLPMIHNIVSKSLYGNRYFSRRCRQQLSASDFFGSSALCHLAFTGSLVILLYIYIFNN